MPGPKPRTEAQAVAIAIAAAVHDGDCLIIQNHAEQKNGYYLLGFQGKQDYAHRCVYREKRGPIHPDLVIRHKCNRKNCIEPTHLLQGTHADNVADKVLADRVPRGRTHYTQRQNL